MAVAVGRPGGFVLGRGSHADGGVRANGARPVDPLGGGEHGWRRCPPKGPGCGSVRPCTRSSEPRPERCHRNRPPPPTEATVSQSARAAPWRIDLYCTPRSEWCTRPVTGQHRLVSAARRPSEGRLGPGRCTGRWRSASPRFAARRHR